jgi:hypothetical protein
VFIGRLMRSFLFPTIVSASFLKLSDLFLASYVQPTNQSTIIGAATGSHGQSLQHQQFQYRSLTMSRHRTGTITFACSFMAHCAIFVHRSRSQRTSVHLHMIQGWNPIEIYYQHLKESSGMIRTTRDTTQRCQHPLRHHRWASRMQRQTRHR